MLIDLHVHTSRYSKCARGPEADLMAAARDHGLDGIVITEHHALWKEAEIAVLRAEYPDIRIFSGIEITTQEEEDILVFGVTDFADLTNRPAAADIIEQVRQKGGAICLAHPLRYRDHVDETFLATPPDACEGWSMNVYAFQRPGIREFCRQTGCGMVAASDSHSAHTVGLYATRFHGNISDEQDLAAALRERAYDTHCNRERLAVMESALPERVEHIRRGLEEGLDRQAIHDRIGCSFSMIDHIRAGRYPSLVGND